MTQTPVKAKSSLLLIVITLCAALCLLSSLFSMVTKTTAPPTATSDPNKLTTTDKAEYQIATEDIVTGILKAPSTAKFPGGAFEGYADWKISLINGIVTVSSYVDAENSFGAPLRSNFTAQYNHSTKALVYFEFDGKAISGSRQP